MSEFDAKIRELAQRFAARTGVIRVELGEMREANDLVGMEDLAHRLAGIAGMFGHDRIGNAALELEQAVHKGGDIESAADELDARLAEVEAA